MRRRRVQQSFRHVQEPFAADPGSWLSEDELDDHDDGGALDREHLDQAQAKIVEQAVAALRDAGALTHTVVQHVPAAGALATFCVTFYGVLGTAEKARDKMLAELAGSGSVHARLSGSEAEEQPGQASLVVDVPRGAPRRMPSMAKLGLAVLLLGVAMSLSMCAVLFELSLGWAGLFGDSDAPGELTPHTALQAAHSLLHALPSRVRAAADQHPDSAVARSVAWLGAGAAYVGAGPLGALVGAVAPAQLWAGRLHSEACLVVSGPWPALCPTQTPLCEAPGGAAEADAPPTATSTSTKAADKGFFSSLRSFAGSTEAGAEDDTGRTPDERFRHALCHALATTNTTRLSAVAWNTGVRGILHRSPLQASHCALANAAPVAAALRQPAVQAYAPVGANNTVVPEAVAWQEPLLSPQGGPADAQSVLLGPVVHLVCAQDPVLTELARRRGAIAQMLRWALGLGVLGAALLALAV